MFGSYPSWGGQHYKTRLTLEASSPAQLEAVTAQMEELGLRPVSYDPHPTEGAWDKIQQFLQENKDPHMTEVLIMLTGSMIPSLFSRWWRSL